MNSLSAYLHESQSLEGLEIICPSLDLQVRWVSMAYICRIEGLGQSDQSRHFPAVC